MTARPVLTALKIVSVLVLATAILLATGQRELWSSLWLQGVSVHNAGAPIPKTYVFSKDPLVVYVKDFVSSQEAAHFVALA